MTHIYSVCFTFQTINFTKPFFAPPVVVVMPKYSYINNYSHSSRCNVVTAWIEVWIIYIMYDWMYTVRPGAHFKEICYIARLSLDKMSSVIGWFLVTCPWSNLNVSRPGYNCTVVARTALCFFVFAIWLFKGKSRYITKHLIYGPSGN